MKRKICISLETRRWLDSKELRRCSPAARALLIDLMCLAMEGSRPGYLADKIGPLQNDFMAKRVAMPLIKFRFALQELLDNTRLAVDGDGVIYVPQMVRDEEIRSRRAAGGVKSLNNPNTPRRKDPGTSAGTGPRLVPAPRERLAMPDGVTEGWEAWWTLWCSVKGNNHEEQALRAWMSVVTPELVAPCMECTASYLASLDKPNTGFYPENFLFDQVRQRFEARFPPAAKNAPRSWDSSEDLISHARDKVERTGRL